MNEPEKERCEEYSRVLLGRALRSSDLEDLLGGSSSYEEFRIHVVQKLAERNDNLRRITLLWRKSAVKADESPDANILLHRIESLTEKQAGLERKMREATVELLGKLKALDSAATAQAGWSATLGETRYQIAEIRRCLEHLEEVPSHGGNGVK